MSEKIMEKLEDFNTRFSVTSKESYEDEFKKFRNRIFNIPFSSIYDYSSSLHFCQIVGRDKSNYSCDIIAELKEQKNEKDFYKTIQVLFYIKFDNYHKKHTLIQQVKECIDLSKINLAIARKGDDIILYPKGEKEFDEKLVNQTLKFLDPESSKEFEQALELYLDYSLENAVDSLSRLSKSIETFLRVKLNNEKNIKDNVKILLGESSDPKNNKIIIKPQIRNKIKGIFNYLYHHFNEEARHKSSSDISENENEFLIYQTGILLRYINNEIPNK